MDIKEASDLIMGLATQSGASITFKDNKLSVGIKQNSRTPQDYTKLADTIDKNRDTFQKAVSMFYYRDVDCKPFQKEINKIFERAGVNHKTPDFYTPITSKWMENLRPEVKNKKMSELILPGTHDSGASKIMWDRTPAIANNFWKKILYKVLQAPIIKNLAERWTVTQKDDIGEQLQKGIRVFDFRLAKDTNDNLCLSHSFIVADFKESIQKIKEFTDKNPKEFITVLIKTDPLYKSIITKEDIKKAQDIIKSDLGKVAVTSDKNTQDYTLKYLQDNNKKIVFHSNFDNKIMPETTLFHQDKNYSGWANVQRTKNILPGITNALSKDKDPGGKFVHASLNTTPNAKVMLKKTLSPKSDNLLERGKKSQKYLYDLLKKSNFSKIQGVKLDNPSRNSIQAVVSRNHKMGSNKSAARSI